MFRGYMESSADLIARIEQLESSLEWQDLGNDKEWRLVSTDSKRLVARVLAVENGFQVSTWQYDSERRGWVFYERDGAMACVKFQAITNILSDDLRKASPQ